MMYYQCSLVSSPHLYGEMVYITRLAEASLTPDIDIVQPPTISPPLPPL